MTVSSNKIRRTARWTAKRYRSEALRRRELRAERKPLVRDARHAVAAAKALDPSGITSAVHTAERGLKTAQRRVPDSLPVFALKSAAGLGTAAYVGLPAIPEEVWAWGGSGAGTMAAGAAVIAIVRSKRAPRGLEPSKEERALLARLQPEHWREHCEKRGLAGTLTGKPKLTESGIVCAVRLDGTWTAAKLSSSGDHVRALLGARTDLRIETKAGKKGGWAELTIRTRSAADGDDLLWTPERRSLGVDTVTGEQVTVPLGERLLIAGRSGAGKSVASRPLLYDASEGGSNALAIIDLKRVEGRLWDHRARVASTPDEVVTLVDELEAEMHDRLNVLPKGQDTWTPTADRPRITVVVDEGAEVVTAAKDALEGLESLARMGRAACIDLWWMTQKPTIGDGVPKQISPQISTSICLAVRTPTEARVVLGEDAQAKGWNADELPAPGVALIRDGKRGPDPVRVRYMDKAVVIALPAQPIWSRAMDPSDRKQSVSMAKAPAPAQDSEGKVLAAIADGAGQVPTLVERTGLSRATVNRLLIGLLDAGQVRRADRGRYALATPAEAM
ncbi:cell division protein FtsK [Streptomyces lunaelactis]|uniref:Cell division protein FtsK n=1 Tax=Streptomyces lunaelactis TaxID=1535768 RepID=A0A2R4TE85_9ACTN|nr:cell division protein FtsK [Streptomyces lunaelactis]